MGIERRRSKKRKTENRNTKGVKEIKKRRGEKNV